MDLFIPSSYKPGKKSSPKWFTSQCAKAVKHKNHRFKQWKLHQTPHSRALSVQARNLCSKTINHAKSPFDKRINNKIASCQTGSRSFWSLAKVVSQNFCHSSFPPLKNNSSFPSSKANLFASTFASNSNLDDQDFQPSLYPTSIITMSPIKFSTRKVRKVLLQLNTSKSSGPDGIPAIVLKQCFSTGVQMHPLGWIRDTKGWNFEKGFPVISDRYKSRPTAKINKASIRTLVVRHQAQGSHW